MTYSRTPRRVRVQWPPAPCVEEEPQSLSRELDGLSKLGDKPGAEGVHFRGAIDQYPILVSATPPPPSVSPDSLSNVPGLGHMSSSDESLGPATPPLHEPVIRNTVRFKDEDAPTPTPAPAPVPQRTVSQSRSQSTRPPQPQQHKREPSVQRESRHSSHYRENPASRPIMPVEYGSQALRSESPPDRPAPRAPVPEKKDLAPPKSSLARSNSARPAPPVQRQLPERLRNEHGSGYLSDSATSSSKPPVHRSEAPVQAPVPTAPVLPVPNGPTLADRIEEKLRQRQERQEQRDPGHVSDTEGHKSTTAAKISNIAIPILFPHPAPATAPHSPTRESRAPNQRVQQEPQTSRLRAQSVTAPPARAMSECRPPPPSRPLPEMMEKSKLLPTLVPVQPVSAPPTTDRSMVQPASRHTSTTHSSPDRSTVQSSSRHPSATRSSPERSTVPSTASRHPSTSPQRPNSTGMGLSPCPRTIAVAGYQDWYTLKGLTHLDICPSCMSQIAHSRYRDFFIPSLAKPANQKTRCAFANAWTRLAWAQMIKKQHDSLELLYQMTRPPPGSRGCPGRIVAEQPWYRVYDPETNSDLSNFHVCNSCVRNVRILMPAHRDTFTQNPEPAERICDFVTSSPRFVKFIDLLDASASRAEADRARRPDTRDFLSYARRKAVLRDCRRDRPTLSTWHFIPSLPEMCVCEDCYDEVVWPLARVHRPIARMVTTSMRILPGDAPGRTREASCQLYSPRMRAKFREAVARDDLGMLESIAKRRIEAERRFMDRREELLEASGRGYDCDEEMRKAVDEWRRWE
ncbi:unnamed protein product [Penicillium salamii]|uniref:Uncharacterized protein n=1 Tax=Penicillium salamii TaxID=1612424 RepID=A0A9W4IHI4_9EURO|nr:unnamed protein product [Penicillium salamii]CAG8255432.1 unnamed protein product [Penicillium salamii]CAG8279086.1 unnamed protein product [Penicillium salamii]CAG8297696.1 unnamed protein product [Penicillium salamii]CAG8391634.1 unnamed protein product [Penicillium salamii]